MKFLKKNKLSIIIVIATLALAGVAIYSAATLYQRRAVAPNAPQSTPGAESRATVISIPLDTSVSGPGQHVLSTQDVSQYNGLTCAVQSDRTQTTVHSGNNITISSGSSSVLLSDVEGSATATTRASQDLILGDSLTVALDMGPDNEFSGGMSISLNCQDLQHQTTQCSALSVTFATATSTATATATATSTSTATATATATATSTATATATATSTTVAQSYSCNSLCSNDSQCQTADSNYICYSQTSTCRHKDYPSQSNCLPQAATGSPNPTFPPNVPQTGTNLPTIAGFGAGIVLIITALVIAL